ncbi:MAG: transketolase [Spirochaetaceae bacterium]|jgi:transketolase|nr:transketolase [Spirochaetaceae bacterium]
MANDERVIAMKVMSAKIRIETICQMTEIGFGHIGGSMSIADVLGVLYGGVMRIEPKNPGWKDRDYLVCSKGHAGPAIYSALALKGYFPMDWLKTLNKPQTNLPSHCDRLRTPGIDMTTGSLGQGLSAAAGIALGNRIDNRDNYTYAIMGDGECEEGQIWEAAMTAGHYKLSNLIAFVDYNGIQIDGPVEMVNNITNFAERFGAFRWHTQEVDGHDVAAIDEAVTKAKAVKDKPSVIVLKTVKGQGCAYVVSMSYNHHIPMPKDKLEESLRILEAEIKSYTDR